MILHLHIFRSPKRAECVAHSIDIQFSRLHACYDTVLLLVDFPSNMALTVEAQKPHSTLEIFLAHGHLRIHRPT
jgi:hypothetical protein